MSGGENGAGRGSRGRAGVTASICSGRGAGKTLPRPRWGMRWRLLDRAQDGCWRRRKALTYGAWPSAAEGEKEARRQLLGPSWAGALAGPRERQRWSPGRAGLMRSWAGGKEKACGPKPRKEKEENEEAPFFRIFQKYFQMDFELI